MLVQLHKSLGLLIGLRLPDTQFDKIKFAWKYYSKARQTIKELKTKIKTCENYNFDFNINKLSKEAEEKAYLILGLFNIVSSYLISEKAAI
jgi:hypothetical protein